MIVICEECGKKYKIDPEKISGPTAKFKCKSCSHLITVQKSETEPTPAPPLPQAESTVSMSLPEPPAPTPLPTAKQKKQKTKREPFSLKLGVRGKMILLFFLLPGVISALSALYTLYQIQESADTIVAESRQSLQKVSESVTIADAKALAAEAKIFFDNHPGILPEELNTNPDFKRTISQTTPWAGYAAVYSLPDADGAWRVWVHTNPKLVGIDFMPAVKNALGEHFPRFWKIFSEIKTTPVSKGYYTWREANGEFREKFMVCVAIEGTPYAITSTAYVSEMLKSATQIEATASERIYFARYINMALMFGTFLLIGFVVSIYGHTLTGKISYLTNVADRISVGDLDTEIQIKSKDEIGRLAEAISRMQDSLRLSIERLRRRR